MKKNLKITFFLLGGLVFISGVVVFCLWNLPRVIQKQNSELFSDLSQYTINSGKIKLMLSDTWNKWDNLTGAGSDLNTIAAFSSNSTKTALIIDKKVFPNGSIKDVSEWEMGTISELTELKIINDSNLEEASKNGILREYIFTRQFVLGSYVSHCYDLMTIIQNDGYIFSMCAQDSLWGDAKQNFLTIIKSVEFIE